MTCLVRSTICGLFIVAGLTGTTPADTVIADFNGDYVAGTNVGRTRARAKHDGWDYLWNASAPIGTAAGNYRSLVWSEASHQYATQNAKLPCAQPGAYLAITSDGGHPGYGLHQPGATFDRFVIAAYTIKKGMEGPASIADSRLKLNVTPQDNNGSGSGVELRVYVNDNLVANFIFIATDDHPISFNRPLGSLKAGDTVYVAVGPNKDDFCDSFGLGYKLVLARTVSEARAASLPTHRQGH